MTPLEPGQLGVMRVHGAMAAAVALILSAFGGLGMAITSDGLLPGWLPSALMLLLVVYPCFVSPARRYRAWGYRIEADELHLAHGVLTRVRTVVPFARVQHIDVAQGPVERAFGVSRLMLHTAGTAHSLVVLPGLAAETAERLRDDIRARIRADAV